VFGTVIYTEMNSLYIQWLKLRSGRKLKLIRLMDITASTRNTHNLPYITFLSPAEYLPSLFR
jgi:hypothetical protein